jgi:hypothetical protein
MERLVPVSILAILLTSACSDTSMSGGDQKVPPHTTKPKPAAVAPSQGDDERDAGSEVDDDEDDRPTSEDVTRNEGVTGAGATATATATNTGTNTTTAVGPDSIVDGEEVVNDCGRCVQRARDLAATLGFAADISRTYNEGYYKISPGYGLCDVHFMNDMRDEIAEHEGHDSRLGNQVAMYCPCNCGWAVDEWY